MLDRWIKFLNNADLYSQTALPEELAEIEQIRKASQKLEVMYLDKKEREYYDSQQKRYLDESSRIQEAVEKAVGEAVEKAVGEAVEKAVGEAVEKAVGEAELSKQTEIAKKLIKRNLSNADIAEDTGLTLEQINQLRKETK